MRGTEVIVEVDLLWYCACGDDGQHVGDQQICLFALLRLSHCTTDTLSRLGVAPTSVDQRRMISMHIIVLSEQDET